MWLKEVDDVKNRVYTASRALACVILLALIFTGCQMKNQRADVTNVQIDYGTSACYTRADIDACAALAKAQFSGFSHKLVLQRLIFMGDDYCPSGDCLILKAVYYDGYIDQTVTDFGWRFSPGEDGEWYIEDFTELSNMGDHI